LELGRTDVTTIFVSLSARDPDGRDLEYLEWHCFDHRPEQYRLAGMRGSLRLASTPECRAARIVSDQRYDALDHVMTYLFTGTDALPPFYALGRALYRAGRMTHRLPQIERDVFHVDGMAAAPRLKVGADVLPWWPSLGVLMLVERGAQTVPISSMFLVSRVRGGGQASRSRSPHRNPTSPTSSSRIASSTTIPLSPRTRCVPRWKSAGRTD